MLGDVPDRPFKGRGRDDRIGLLTPEQMMKLKRMGGAGTINPKTGLPEYDWGDSSGDYGSYSDGGDASGNSGDDNSGDDNGGGGLGDYDWQGDPAGENVASESFNASHAAMGPNDGPQEPSFWDSPFDSLGHKAGKFAANFENNPAGALTDLALLGASAVFAPVGAASLAYRGLAGESLGDTAGRAVANAGPAGDKGPAAASFAGPAGPKGPDAEPTETGTDILASTPGVPAIGDVSTAPPPAPSTGGLLTPDAMQATQASLPNGFPTPTGRWGPAFGSTAQHYQYDPATGRIVRIS